jgi:hypothetical protein
MVLVFFFLLPASTEADSAAAADAAGGPAAARLLLDGADSGADEMPAPAKPDYCEQRHQCHEQVFKGSIHVQHECM